MEEPGYESRQSVYRTPPPWELAFKHRSHFLCETSCMMACPQVGQVLLSLAHMLCAALQTPNVTLLPSSQLGHLEVARFSASLTCSSHVQC
jgi:hypothetical protein